MLMVKNKVYRWFGRFYLVPEGSTEVFKIRNKPPLKHLPKITASTVKSFGELVGKDFNPK